MVRAVLVQRDEPAWSGWADVTYPLMTDFVEALNAREQIVPWEYREIYESQNAASESEVA